MNPEKKKKLEAKGWKIGSATDFLELTQEEAEYIELKLILSKTLEKQRQQKKLTQLQVARKLNSSQSRVAKMEKGDPSVSLDLIINALLSLGINRKSLAAIIA